ncbi:MAG: DMT family transporter [Gammaproteobacteria bacterium]|nr:DMT family transporter [Gammaproteobacteria bacterium]MDH3447197.1 DMT family transporter [Gammaproteobacteria bacterium]
MKILTHSASLYAASVLIWGSTWYAIKFQLGLVAAEVSLVYRFALAAAILLLFCVLSRRTLRYSPREHGYIALQGLFLFSSNYLVFYWATGLLTSGIVALIFSTVILMNIVNAAIFMRLGVSQRVLVGAIFGIAGIVAIFWSEVSALNDNADTLRGLWMCILATYFASVGNIISARNQKQQIPVIQTNAWGMAYGAIFMAVYAWFSDVPFNYDPAPAYSASLLYLSLFGSILAFGSYLTLVGRIGADRAAYAALLFPVIALGLSTLFEDYQWTLRAVFGFALVLLGNYIVLTGRKAPLPLPQE